MRMKSRWLALCGVVLTLCGRGAEQIIYDDLRLKGQLLGVTLTASGTETNAVLSMERTALWATNAVTCDAVTGIYEIGELTSYAGYTATVVKDPTKLAPASFTFKWTTDNLTWHQYATNGLVYAAIFMYPTNLSRADYLTNVTVFGFDFPERWGATNDLRFQDVYADTPTYRQEVSTKGYTDGRAAAAVQAWSTWNATNPVVLAGQRLTLTDSWQLLSHTNETDFTTVAFQFLGSSPLAISGPALGNGLITNIGVTNDTVTIHVLSNGITGPIAPEYISLPTSLRSNFDETMSEVANVDYPGWHWRRVSSYTSTYPTADANGWFTLTFSRPYTNNAFIRVRPIGAAIAQLNNGMLVPSNSLALWPTAPRSPGDAYFGNSNGVVYVLTSGTGSSWTSTNKLAP